MKDNNFGIYVHIPFCVSKCEYCSFISKCANENEIQEYINYLCDEIYEISYFYKNKVISTIYFGGGTPSFINACHIKRILETIYNNYNIKADAEISIECNPCSASYDKLKIYKEIGINRISFGVQSLNDNSLKILGRKHTSDMAKDIISLAKKVGFNNISADLMIGIPNQTKEDLIFAIDCLAKLGITHISAYMLMLEEGTPLFEKIKSRKLSVANDDECVELYNALVGRLEELGFNRYEISNFCKSGYECKHNVNYWDMGEYLGFGIASHSYVNGVRFEVTENFKEYYKKVENLKKYKNSIKIVKNDGLSNKINKKITKNNLYSTNKSEKDVKNFYKTYETLSKTEIIEETIMLGLRQTKGVSILALNKLNYDILRDKKQILKKLEDENIIQITKTHIKLNPQHFGVCSAVVVELLP